MEVTAEDDGHLDFSSLDVTKHSGLLLDGVGDVLLLKRNRETLQGRPKALRGGRSQTMRFAYPFTLARRAVVVTMDLSAANINLLDSDHWLSDARNVKVLRLNEQAWVSSSSTLPRTVTQDPRDVMRRWRAADVTAFLTANDLEGPADVLFKNGVGGEDLATLTMAVMTRDLRLSAFAAGKILTARSAFLG